MQLLSRAKNLFLDFLFPKDEKVVELENLSVGEVLSRCPAAEKLRDEDVLALFDYSHKLTKTLVWEVKYKGNKILAEKLASILYDTIKHELSERILFEAGWRNSLPIILLPIPMSEKRRLERGWNQTELLAEKVAALDTEGLFRYAPGHLLKIRHTESQTGTSSGRKRRENIADSMSVNNSPVVSGKCAVVIDDVVTTGATFQEASRALRAAGAKKILCIAVAH